jgi:hypothetical protein
MGTKLLVALLLIALAIVLFKFLREREARLRERAALAERLARRRAAEENSAASEGGRRAGETLDLRRDPRTGVYVPKENGEDGNPGGGRGRTD